MRKEKKYHYIYKTTCNVTNKYYIGMHSTDDLDDTYMGSGKRLWFSINYHGKENHTKKILEFCDNRKVLKEREEEIVNEQLLTEDLCMNLMVGGQGGFVSLSACTKGGYARAKSTNRIMWVENREKYVESYSKYNRDRWKNDPIYRDKMLKVINWKGRKHSDETKEKMSEMRKGNGIGNTNSQYGTCWITKDGENKKIKKEDLVTYINDGWVKGRKLK